MSVVVGPRRRITPPSFANEYSMTFDGVDEYFNGASTFSELDGQNKATFSMWVKPALNTSSFALYVASASDRAYTIVIYNTGIIRMQMQSSGLYVTTNTGVLTANEWQHILICIDLSLAFSSRGAIFVNGVDVTSGNNLNLTTFITSAGSLLLSNSSLFYDGLMDEVSMWVGTDQRANVSDIYNGGVPFDLSTLATAPSHWWRMGDGDSWSGSQWTLTDNIGSYDLISANMEEADRVTDVP